MTASIQITYVLRSGESRTVESAANASVMAAAQRNGVPGLLAECGGACACATCHVYVQDDFVSNLPEISPFEDEMLNTVAAGRLPNSRLSCQIKLTPALEGIVVTIPEQL